MRVLVAGAGAIGQMLGARLRLADQDVSLLCRPAHAAAVRERLQVTGHTDFDGPIPCITDPDEADSDFDAIFITCKAHATEAMARSLAPLVGPRTVVCSLQNGLGNGEALARHVPREQVAVAVTSHGVDLVAPGRLDHTGTGATKVGPLDPEAREGVAHQAATLLDRAGLEPAWHEEMAPQVWAKAIVNAGINPVGAANGATNGQVLADPAMMAEVADLVAEAVAVAGAAGVALPDLDFQKMVRRTLEDTAANRCSMLQDVQAGRRTEIHQITGEVVRLGRHHGIKTPASDAALAAVEALHPA